MSNADGRIRLLTRGDDAASCRSANRAMRDAFEQGIMRNAGVMAPCPELEHAYELLGGLKGLCIGLHVTLTAEWDRPRWGPLLGAARVPSLCEADGSFRRDGMALHNAEADPEQMLAETQAQLARLREVGFEVEYVDFHMGVSWLPGYQEAVGEWAKREGLIRGDLADRLPTVEESGLNKVDRLVAQLRKAGPGDYLAVAHPCYDDEEVNMHRENSSRAHIAADRNEQRRMFMDPTVLRVVQELGIEPTAFRDL